MTSRLWVIGDSWTDPTYGGWGWTCGWPQQVAAALGWALINSGRSGAGYAQPGNDWATFGSIAARGDGVGADVVIVAGSRNDPDTGQSQQAIANGAEHTYRLIRAACPDALLLVIGPQGTSIAPSAELLRTVATVRAAALDAGAAWVDPTGWLRGRPDLLDMPDGHPLCAGHDLLADRIAPELLRAYFLRSARATPPDPPDGVGHGDEGGWVAPWAADDAATLPSPPVLCGA